MVNPMTTPTTHPISAVIVDDEPLAREGLRLCFSEARGGCHAVAKFPGLAGDAHIPTRVASAIKPRGTLGVGRAVIIVGNSADARPQHHVRSTHRRVLCEAQSRSRSAP